MQVWVSALVVGHVIGALFLLYSLEKTMGIVSKSFNRATGRRSPASCVASPAKEAGASLARVVSADDQGAYERAPRWARGCACKVRCGGGERRAGRRRGG